MKLGKGTFLAIIETALFTFGAIFFLLVLIIPSNPIWALAAGIVCGLAGAIIWSCPFFVHLGQKLRRRIETTKINPEDIAKQILDDDDLEKNGYELHRIESYDNPANEILPDLPERPNA